MSDGAVWLLVILGGLGLVGLFGARLFFAFDMVRQVRMAETARLGDIMAARRMEEDRLSKAQSQLERLALRKDELEAQVARLEARTSTEFILGLPRIYMLEDNPARDAVAQPGATEWLVRVVRRQKVNDGGWSGDRTYVLRAISADMAKQVINRNFGHPSGYEIMSCRPRAGEAEGGGETGEGDEDGGAGLTEGAA